MRALVLVVPVENEKLSVSVVVRVVVAEELLLPLPVLVPVLVTDLPVLSSEKTPWDDVLELEPELDRDEEVVVVLPEVLLDESTVRESLLPEARSENEPLRSSWPLSLVYCTTVVLFPEP